MEVEEHYEVPFDVYDWRYQLWARTRDLYSRAIFEEVKKYMDLPIEIDANYTSTFFNYAMDDKLFDRINKKAKKYIREDYID